jgi:hypothetical protein
VTGLLLRVRAGSAPRSRDFQHCNGHGRLMVPVSGSPRRGCQRVARGEGLGLRAHFSSRAPHWEIFWSTPRSDKNHPRPGGVLSRNSRHIWNGGEVVQKEMD